MSPRAAVTGRLVRLEGSHTIIQMTHMLGKSVLDMAGNPQCLATWISLYGPLSIHVWEDLFKPKSKYIIVK
jgi:hypothetical protein